MIALVPWAERKNAQSYKNNVMKYACYGHDERAGKYQYGDCKHPCNTRPGCEYQSSKKTFENYSLETTETKRFGLVPRIFITYVKTPKTESDCVINMCVL